MDTIPAVILIFGVAFVWLGVPVVLILRSRRRRGGPRPVRPAAQPADQAHHPAGVRWRRLRRIADQNSGTPVKRHNMKVRKVHGKGLPL